MIRRDSVSLSDFLQLGPYTGYAYSYPHKTAYRPLEEPQSLATVWAGQNLDLLFLYCHIPFCEVRCGFCNLFTFSQPDEDVPTLYLKSLRRQAETVRNHLSQARFGRLAIGGGTPSFLNIAQLHFLFLTLQETLGINGRTVPISFEVSPGTVELEKLRAMKDFGVDRVSMGIQSLHARDTASLGRPQKQLDVYHAIDLIRGVGFPTLNLDLIYGAQEQSIDSWKDSVAATLKFRPEEIYLYPLYVRPLTGLAKIHKPASDLRPELYRVARSALLTAGYEQISMRMFQLPKPSCDGIQLTNAAVPDYSCQRDGMIGLGCGARSYTSSLHYGSRYAVKQPSILRLINDFIGQSDVEFSKVTHGIWLDDEEQRRRYLILSLLLVEGLDCNAYEARFRASPLEHFPALVELCIAGLAQANDHRLTLTERGIEWSDAIGPWLYSARVRSRMAEFPWID